MSLKKLRLLEAKVSSGIVVTLEHGGELWVRLADVHPMQDKIIALESKLDAAEKAEEQYRRLLDEERLLFTVQASRLGACVEALECLLPGLTLDLRYAEPDDDKDAMRSRIKTVTDALQASVVERGSTNSELPVLARIERADGSSTTIYDGPNTPSE